MYRFGIWLIAFALVLNGMVAYAWEDSPAAPVGIAQNHQVGITVVECDAQPNNAVAVDPSHTGSDTHNHLKCCATCNVLTLIPDVAAVPVTFSYRAAVFRIAQHDLIGHLVALDPGIPKSVV